MSEDLYWRLHALSKLMESSGIIDEDRDKALKPYATILDAMNAVRSEAHLRAQPVELREEIDDEVCQIMAEHGPDGHVDGHEVLTDMVLRRVAAALAQPAVQGEPVAWFACADRMPDSGVIVLACYTNSAGNARRIRATWLAEKTHESDTDSEIGVYDEEADCYFDPEGWYEQIDNWGDYSAVAVSEGDVTHWMPLPAAPGAHPPSQPPREPLTDEQIDAACKTVPAAVYELMHGHEITLPVFRNALREVARAVLAAQERP